MAVLGSLVVVSWLVVAAAHIDDTYNVDHVSGAWLALARAASDGELYPPLYDGEHFGGTRYMPLGILLYAGAVKIGSNDLAWAKLAAYAVAALLLAVTYLALRRLGCGRALSVGLTATVLVSFTGLFAATTVYGDALPALLQLSSVALVARSSSKPAVAAAGVLAGLALLSKVSAAWALAGVAVYLLAHVRHRLVLFLGVALGVAVAGLLVAQLASDGRMLDNVGGLIFAGEGGAEALFLESPQKLVGLVQESAAATWILVPFALLGTGLGFAERAATAYHFSLLAACAVLLVVLADSGTDFNHLVDLVVLVAIVTGAFAVRVSVRHDRDPLLSAVVLVALVVTLAGSYQVRLRADTREAVEMILGAATPSAYDPQPLADRVDAGETVLSDDPFVPLSLGDRPVVLDAFMLPRILRKHPDWRADLIERIERHEFDKVVLLLPLDLADPWWTESHLGIEVASALAREYRYAGRAVGAFDYYRIYVPRTRNGSR